MPATSLMPRPMPPFDPNIKASNPAAYNREAQRRFKARKAQQQFQERKRAGTRLSEEQRSKRQSAHNRRFTDRQAWEIRFGELATESHGKVAARYCVSRSVIVHLRQGKTYRYLNPIERPEE